METVTVLKTEIAVTNVNKVSEDLVNKNKISVAICNANTLVRCYSCLLYTSPSPRDGLLSRMPSSA